MAASRAGSRIRTRVRRHDESEDSARMRDMIVDQHVAETPRAPASFTGKSNSSLKRDMQSSGCCGRASTATVCTATAVIVTSAIGFVRVFHADKTIVTQNSNVSVEHVFWHAWLTAVSTAFGVIPFAVAACLRRRNASSPVSSSSRRREAAPAAAAVPHYDHIQDDDDDGEDSEHRHGGSRERVEQELCTARLSDAALQQRWHGLANALAAGMMVAASCCLLWEGATVSHSTMLPDVVAAAAAVVAAGPEALGQAAVGSRPVHPLQDVLLSPAEVEAGGAAASAGGTLAGTSAPQLAPIRAVLQQSLEWFSSAAAPVTTAAAALSPQAAAQTLGGLAAGALFVWLSSRFLHANEDLSLLTYLSSTAAGPSQGVVGGEKDKGGRSRTAALAQAKRMLLMVAVMFLHSAAEGIGLGVSFGTQHGGTVHAAGGAGDGHAHAFGSLISLTLAVHNVPEGLATALVLLPSTTSAGGAGTGTGSTSHGGGSATAAAGKQMTLLAAALWAVFTSLPQPLLAVPAFLAVQSARALLPIGLGFAAGAMLTVALTDLLPEALVAAAQQGGKRATIATTVCAALGMFALQAVLKD